LREVPILTFVNRLGREGRDPFDLIEEIQKSLIVINAPLTTISN
jgi:peptide chain release factor 3